jgi:hypothetical protein
MGEVGYDRNCGHRPLPCIPRKYSRKGALPDQAYGVCVKSIVGGGKGGY